MPFFADSHCAQRINPEDLGVTVILHLAEKVGEYCLTYPVQYLHLQQSIAQFTNIFFGNIRF